MHGVCIVPVCILNDAFAAADAETVCYIFHGYKELELSTSLQHDACKEPSPCSSHMVVSLNRGTTKYVYVHTQKYDNPYYRDPNKVGAILGNPKTLNPI